MKMRFPSSSRSRIASALIAASALAALSACGGGDDAAVPAPTLGFTALGTTVEITNYMQTGRYPLPVRPAGVTTPNLLAQEASAVTYNKDTDTLFVVGDGSTAVVQVNKKGELIDSMTLAAGGSPQGTSFYDTEGISYVGAGKFVLIQERYRAVSQFTYTPNGTISLSDTQTVTLGTTVGNIGLEGLSYDPMTGGYVLVKEATPSGVFQTGINFTTLTATNGSPTTDNSVNLFDPALVGLTSFADIYALSNVLPATAIDYSHLLILSGPDGKVVQMDRTGKKIGSISVGIPPQNEGMTMDQNRVMYLANEVGGGTDHPELHVWSPTIDRRAVGVGSNLYLTFDKDVVAGTGSFVVQNDSGDRRTIAVTDATQVSISGKTVKIDPTLDLAANKPYTITYDAGIVKYADGALVGAVSNVATLAFKTYGPVDSTAPSLSSSSPADNATGVNATTISLTFNEAIAAGTGNIVITNGSTDVRNIAVTDATQVSITGTTLTITPATALIAGGAYSVQMAAGVVKDIAGNSYAGILSATTLNFTVAAAPPTVLNAGDVLFLGINTDSTDAYAFVILKAITAGTQIAFTDKDYTPGATPEFVANEAIGVWTADVAYAAGTIVTVQPDQAAGVAPIVDKGTYVGSSGGLSQGGETVYAFQGTVAGLTNTSYTSITVDRFLATINAGGAAAGTIPAAVTAAGSAFTFTTDNNKYGGSLDRSDLTVFANRVKDVLTNWTGGNDTTAFPLSSNSLFP
jgi:uncharacterized protein YjiK/methionine-rich copper-binding protein CopC